MDRPTSQDCTYILSWDWQRGDGGPADGFIVQQIVDDNGEWYDIYEPLPLTACWRPTRSCAVKSFLFRQSVPPSPQPITPKVRERYHA